MKQHYFILILICNTLLLNSQIIINEIMYNPPESGADYLEYIEFYNTSASQINIKDYSIEDAVVITFPDTTIQGFGFFLIAVDAVKLDSVLGAKAMEWRSGALRNSDEIITLLDENKKVVDSVHYYVSWSGETNGNGASLELCRSTADNSQSIYWRPSLNITGIQVNNKTIKATPGYLNSVSCGDHTIIASNFKFTPDYREIYTGDQVEWINQIGEHNINGLNQSFPDNPVGFGNGAPSSAKWTFVFKFDSPGTYHYQCDVHINQGMTGTIIVRNKDINYPNISIGLATSIDNQGILDSLNKQFTMEGIVYGVNLRPNGLQFTIIDQFNDGIGVFNSSGNLGYTVTEGDFIIVKGLINQFNGLAQIVPDSAHVVSSGNILFSPAHVTDLNESTESQLIELKNVELMDPNTWTNSPLGFTVKITDGQNEWELRIDNDVDIHGIDAPPGRFNVTGLGTQFDLSIPYLDGYQIMPRYLADIELITRINDLKNESVFIYPNPVFDKLHINSSEFFESVQILNFQGNVLYTSQFSKLISLDLPAGMYFLNLFGKVNRIVKFIKL